MTQKIVINTCFGGFCLSEKAETLYRAYADLAHEDYSAYALNRDCPILVKVIEQLGVGECSGKYASLKIVEIPDGVNWEIQDYDGKEHVAEDHRTWY